MKLGFYILICFILLPFCTGMNNKNPLEIKLPNIPFNLIIPYVLACLIHRVFHQKKLRMNLFSSINSIITSWYKPIKPYISENNSHRNSVEFLSKRNNFVKSHSSYFLNVAFIALYNLNIFYRIGKQLLSIFVTPWTFEHDYKLKKI